MLFPCWDKLISFLHLTNLQNFISQLFVVVSDVHKANTSHRDVVKTFEESIQAKKEAHKLKAQTLERIEQGKARDAELEAKLKDLEQKMNKVKEKHTSLVKAMKVGEQALGKIDKMVIKLAQEKEEKKPAIEAVTVIPEKAQSIRDEVA